MLAFLWSLWARGTCTACTPTAHLLHTVRARMLYLHTIRGRMLYLHTYCTPTAHLLRTVRGHGQRWSALSTRGPNECFTATPSASQPASPLGFLRRCVTLQSLRATRGWQASRLIGCAMSTARPASVQ